MTIGLVGRKVGMMRIFTDEGDAQPVTVLDVSDNRITQIKTADKDGYSAVQVAFGRRRASRVSKPLAGHLAKAAVEAGHTLREFRAKPEDLAALTIEASAMARVPLAGTNYTVGQTEQEILAEVKRLLAIKAEEELTANQTAQIADLRTVES